MVCTLKFSGFNFTICQFYDLNDLLRCVSWNPSGSLLATCGGDCTIKIWAQRANENGELEWKCLDTLRDGHTRTIRWISWSPCGSKIGLNFH